MCTGSKCKNAGGKEFAKEAKTFLKENHLKKDVLLLRTSCTGNCKLAPVVHIQPQNKWLTKFSDKELKKFLQNSLCQAVELM